MTQRSTIEFRRLFRGAYGVLLACCALVVVLWAGSHRSAAQLRLPVVEGGTRWVATSYRGILVLAMIEDYPGAEPLLTRVRHNDPDAAAIWDYQSWGNTWLGMSFEDSQIWVPTGDDRVRVPRRWTGAHLPYWLLFVITVTGPLHGLFLVCRAYRRATHDCCGVCGYALGGGTTCQACAARAVLIGASPRVRLVAHHAA